ncbi:MAG TPA: ABC transporter ATP-binding protein [Gemmatimonadales bacterium]|nr:ABC transporter ATP-binding protein [Gemmatimonadales bacterium]
MTALLEAGGLTKRFAGVCAVDGVSFGVEAGRVHAVIGPNGAGKTTLFNLITGFEKADGGEVRLDGRDVSGFPPHRLARLGVGRTFQTPQVCADLSALENVMLGAHLRLRRNPLLAMLRAGGIARGDRELRERAAGLLEFAGIAPCRDLPGRAMAYGDLKRLEIARALAAEPRLLCLDEPAAGLNPRENEDLGTLIRRIAESGVTVLLVEHDMRLVMSLSDHIVVLDYGRKLAEGTPDEVGRNPEVLAAYLGTHA